MSCDFMRICNQWAKDLSLQYISDGNIKQMIISEWTILATFVLVVPVQLFTFLWFLSGGPLSNYSFVARYFNYFHVLVYILLMAVFRTVLINILQEDQPITSSISSSSTNLKPLIQPSQTEQSKSSKLKDKIENHISSPT